MYRKVCYTCEVVVVVVFFCWFDLLIIFLFVFPFSLPSSFSITRLQWSYPLYIRRESVEAASIAWVFHEIRPVSYRRIWNGFLVFCLAVFSMVWDRTPCHPILNYLASNVGRVSLWVNNEHFTYFFLAEAYQHEWLRQEAVRKCGGFNDLEGQ